MDSKTKELVEAAEARAQAVSSGSRVVHIHTLDGAELLRIDSRGDLIGDTGPNGTFYLHAPKDIPALCAIIREQDAEIERLRSMLAAIVQLHDHANALSNQGESGKIFERACDAYRDAINEARALIPTSP